jgi:hypothetical protein
MDAKSNNNQMCSADWIEPTFANGAKGWATRAAQRIKRWLGLADRMFAAKSKRRRAHRRLKLTCYAVKDFFKKMSILGGRLSLNTRSAIS